MSDLTIVRSGELMLASAEAETDVGVEFVDAWFPKRKDANMQVLDAGRIILETADLDEFISDAKRGGLAIEVKEGV